MDKTIDKLGKITLINGDCLEYMRNLPDKAFDLAIVDPPYGDGNGTCVAGDSRGRLVASQNSRFERYAKNRGGVLEQIRTTIRPLQEAESTMQRGGAVQSVRNMRQGGGWFAKYGDGDYP